MQIPRAGKRSVKCEEPLQENFSWKSLQIRQRLRWKLTRSHSSLFPEREVPTSIIILGAYFIECKPRNAGERGRGAARRNCERVHGEGFEEIAKSKPGVILGVRRRNGLDSTSGCLWTARLLVDGAVAGCAIVWRDTMHRAAGAAGRDKEPARCADAPRVSLHLAGAKLETKGPQAAPAKGGNGGNPRAFLRRASEERES